MKEELEIICPYCGETDDRDNIYMSGAKKCYKCQKWYEWQENRTVTYVTRKIHQK